MTNELKKSHVVVNSFYAVIQLLVCKPPIQRKVS